MPRRDRRVTAVNKVESTGKQPTRQRRHLQLATITLHTCMKLVSEPNSTPSICCGLVAEQVVQQAVEHCQDMLSISFFYGLVAKRVNLPWISCTARCTTDPRQIEVVEGGL